MIEVGVGALAGIQREHQMKQKAPVGAPFVIPDVPELEDEGEFGLDQAP